MGKKRQRPVESKQTKNSLVDFISSLAKETTSQSDIKPKAERIEKRRAKKQRREERQSRYATGSTKHKEHDQSHSKRAARNGQVLDILAEIIRARVESWNGTSRKRPRPYEVTTNMKIAKHRKGNWTDDSIQPRARDYGGMGLARKSLYLSLDDPAFFPKLTEEFLEHIPGFFGKQRTKAMKKQLNKDMLWKRLSDKSQMEKKVNGRKLSQMSPDERVEAMIASGLM